MTGRAARRLGHPVGLLVALSLLALAGCGGPLQEASVGGVASYERGKQAFDKGDWTGRSWNYRVEEKGNNIGDFNMIDTDTGLIIERDTLEGLPEDECKGPARPDCYPAAAKFKRVYKISLKDADADGFVKKIGYIDLMNIADPNKLARVGGKDGKFTFPFVTIEDVAAVDADHIIVANDNNLPYSSGRQIGKQDDNEFILLRVPEFLRAR